MSAAGFAVWQQQLHITLIFIEETRKQLFRYKIAISPMERNQQDLVKSANR